MKTYFRNYLPVTALLSIILMAFTSCAPQIELTSSWTNKQAQVKNSPKIMVMVLGSNLTNRQAVEADVVAELTKLGHTGVSALDLFPPDIQKYDSVNMVTILRKNNIDMLFTTAVVNITEQEKYVPGTTEQVPVGTYATPYNPYYANNYYYDTGYNNYYGYYNNYSYQTMYETRTTEGYTYVDVEVIIESKLYDVNKPELLWFGQSKSYTKDPSSELFKSFAKIVVGDLNKNNLLRK
jgi:hypothetical protein